VSQELAPSLFGWWVTMGTVATLIEPCGHSEALRLAAEAFRRHGRRRVDEADLVARPADELDHARMSRARDAKRQRLGRRQRPVVVTDGQERWEL